MTLCTTEIISSDSLRLRWHILSGPSYLGQAYQLADNALGAAKKMNPGAEGKRQNYSVDIGEFRISRSFNGQGGDVVTVRSKSAWSGAQPLLLLERKGGLFKLPLRIIFQTDGDKKGPSPATVDFATQLQTARTRQREFNPSAN